MFNVNYTSRLGTVLFSIITSLITVFNLPLSNTNSNSQRNTNMFGQQQQTFAPDLQYPPTNYHPPWPHLSTSQHPLSTMLTNGSVSLLSTPIVPHSNSKWYHEFGATFHVTGKSQIFNKTSLMKVPDRSILAMVKVLLLNLLVLPNFFYSKKILVSLAFHQLLHITITTKKSNKRY